MAKKAPQLDAKGYRKFGMLDKLAYAAGDAGCNLSFGLKGTVQTFWLVYMMLETGVLSILLLLVQAWDAINDPIIGAMIDADQRKYKRGKFKTYILIGAIGLIVGGAAVFLPFPGADDVVKAILFVVGYIIWDAAYTMANVPYGSMLSLVTEDAGERAQLSTWRSIGGMVGGMVPGIILPMIIWKDVVDETTGEVLGQDLLGDRVFWAALLMGGIAFLFFWFMINKITLRVDEYSVKTGEEAPKFNVIRAFGNFMKNRAAVGATITAMGMFLGMQSATTANAIMFATYFKQAQLSGLVQMVGFLPMFLFMPFIKKLVNRFGKKEAATAGTVVSLVGGLVMLVFPMVPMSAALPVYMVGLVLFGLGMGVYTCVSWAMMSDAIDYNEWKFGTREEGTVYSLHSFFRKLAQGIGPSIVIALLGVLGYVSDLGTTGQDPIVAYRACWLVAGLYLFSAVCQFVGIGLIYNLDKKTLATMTEELNARRAGDAAPVAPEVANITIE
ncbi:MAG: MFS transporter [Clostridia bacterium]|nr:MFS transporter [Clostridia bacterium]